MDVETHKIEKGAGLILTYRLTQVAFVSRFPLDPLRAVRDGPDLREDQKVEAVVLGLDGADCGEEKGGRDDRRVDDGQHLQHAVHSQILKHLKKIQFPTIQNQKLFLL